MAGIDWVALYALLGAFAGFMSGLLGVGGGGILVPVLAMVFAWQGIATDHVVQLALGTALACMLISSAASMRAHASRGNVAWKMFYAIAPGIMAGAFATSHVAANLDSAWIALFFAAFMAFMAVVMFLDWKPGVSTTPARSRDAFFVGAGIGSVSALAAVGGGFLAVTYLNYKNTPMKKAVGTSAAIGLPIAVAGTVGYAISGWSKTQGAPYTLGFVYVPAFLAISAAAFIAAPYGARCAHHLPDAHLKKIFAVITLALSIRMLASVMHF